MPKTRKNYRKSKTQKRKSRTNRRKQHGGKFVRGESLNNIMKRQRLSVNSRSNIYDSVGTNPYAYLQVKPYY
jgi:hypothetical protein